MTKYIEGPKDNWLEGGEEAVVGGLGNQAIDINRPSGYGQPLPAITTPAGHGGVMTRKKIMKEIDDILEKQLVEERILIHPKTGQPFYRREMVRPETLGYGTAEKHISENIKFIEEQLNFIGQNARKFSHLAPTQREGFVKIVSRANDILGRLGKEMYKDVKQKKAESGAALYTTDDPTNPMNRARSHLKNVLKYIKLNSPALIENELSDFSHDYAEALHKFQQGSQQKIVKSSEELNRLEFDDVKDGINKQVQKDFGGVTAGDTFTPTYGGDSRDTSGVFHDRREKIKNKVDELVNKSEVEKDISEIRIEAKPAKIKTKLQEDILGDVIYLLEKYIKEHGISKQLAENPINISDKLPPESYDKESLRRSIIGEYDAINLYEQLADMTENEKLRDILLDIAREEKVHVGEFEDLLNKIDPEHLESINEGIEEQNIDKEIILNRVSEFLNKAKIYLAPGENPPEGVSIRIGKRGGRFYEGKKPERKYIVTPSGAKVPPAWTNVQISKNPGAKVQATGFDSKGRKVFIYSAKFVGKRKVAKFNRLKNFMKDYPKLMERIEKDKSKNEEAAVLYLISQTGFRIGSDQETKAKVKAYGASTLKHSHVKVSGNKLSFDFVGKKGVHITKTIANDWLANKLGKISRDPEEKLFDTDDYRIRKYLSSIPHGHKYNVKDFRTHLGTSIALKVMKKLPKPDSKSAFRKFRNAVGDKVAKTLGNTRTIALNSYVAPECFSIYEEKLK